MWNSSSGNREERDQAQLRDWVTNGCNVNGILNTMKAEQCEHKYCKFGDTYIKYRKVVAEWMVDVCEYFALHPTTTHASIAYLDRLQPNEKFSRFEWQMLAISCILIAAKYNECEDPTVPDLATLEEITQQRITNETLRNFELQALRKMGWKLNARTPIAFLSSYMVYQGGLIKEDDLLEKLDIFDKLALYKEQNRDNNNNNDNDISQDSNTSTSTSTTIDDSIKLKYEITERVNNLANCIATVCILNIEYKRFLASDMAIAIIHFIRERLADDVLLSPIWSETMKNHIGTCDQTQIQEILYKIRNDDIILTNINNLVTEGGNGNNNDHKINGSNSTVTAPKKEHNSSPTNVNDVDAISPQYNNKTQTQQYYNHNHNNHDDSNKENIHSNYQYMVNSGQNSNSYNDYNH